MVNNFQFTVRKATKQRKKARIAVVGPAGSGKTKTSLMLAKALGGKTAVLDSEAGTSNIYANEFDFDVVDLTEEADGINTFNPERYVAAIHFLEDNGYANIIIDSMTHAWSGEGGILEIVDKAAQTKFSGNSYYAWASGTPLHRNFIDAIQQSKANIIATMRTKTEYAESSKANGRKVYEKIGTKTIQRDDTDYEFDFVLRMTVEHVGFVEKSRIGMDGETVRKPDEKFLSRIAELLQGGAEGPGEVVAQVQIAPEPVKVNGNGQAAVKVVEYPKSKVGFCQWAKDTYKLEPAGVGAILTGASMTFDVANWDELQKAVEESQELVVA